VVTLGAHNRHGIGTVTVFIDTPSTPVELTLAQAEGLAFGLYRSGEHRFAAALALLVAQVRERY